MSSSVHREVGLTAIAAASTARYGDKRLTLDELWRASGARTPRSSAQSGFAFLEDVMWETRLFSRAGPLGQTFSARGCGMS